MSIAERNTQHALRHISVSLPIYLTHASCGFASPADEFSDEHLSLDAHLIKHPNATFFIRASGDSMIGAGIHPGDLLVVDRAVNAISSNIVLAVINGEFTIKRLIKSNNTITLKAENTRYNDIVIGPYDDFYVWGVILHVIHPLT